MLSMIQVQVLHSFYQDFYIPFINIFLPLGNPTHAFNDYYIPFSNIYPPWQPSHAFNDCYIPFIKYFPPLPTQPMLSMITTFLLSKFEPPPPWQPMLSMIQVQVLRFFYQDLCIHFIKISLLATQPMLSMITPFLLSTFDFPLGNPCFQ